MPIAITPIDGQLQAVARQLAFQRGDQCTVLIVDRAPAIEVIVMFRDGEHALARHVAAAQYILEKRHDVVRLFGSSERKHQNGVMLEIRHP